MSAATTALQCLSGVATACSDLVSSVASKRAALPAGMPEQHKAEAEHRQHGSPKKAAVPEAHVAPAPAAPTVAAPAPAVSAAAPAAAVLPPPAAAAPEVVAAAPPVSAAAPPLPPVAAAPRSESPSVVPAPEALPPGLGSQADAALAAAARAVPEVFIVNGNWTEVHASEDAGLMPSEEEAEREAGSPVGAWSAEAVPESEEVEEQDEYEEEVWREPAVRAAVLLDHVAFFSGHWPGTRNDWTGEVGIRFLAQTPCVVTALGRHTTEDKLSEGAVVTLWSAESQQVIANVEVGPDSFVESNYAFTTLPQRVVLEVGKEYRVSQRCKSRMADWWFDGHASEEEVTALASSRYARFLGGCCRNDGGYPNRNDGERRRAGMVNFKIAREGLEVVFVSREELAHSLAHAASVEESSNSEATDAYLGVIARLLALLVDELTVPVFAVVAPEADVSSVVRMEYAIKGDEGNVFSKRFVVDVAKAGHEYGGAFDEHGAPLEAAFVVGHRGGEVLVAAAGLQRLSALSGGVGGDCLGAAELAALLPRGMAFVRSPAGDVTAFLATEVRQGRALRLGQAGTSSAL